MHMSFMLVMNGGVLLVMLSDISLICPLAVQSQDDYYMLEMKSPVVRMSLRGTPKELEYVKSLDICSIIASGCYSLAVGYLYTHTG
jgi:hypothetical protein